MLCAKASFNVVCVPNFTLPRGILCLNVRCLYNLYNKIRKKRKASLFVRRVKKEMEKKENNAKKYYTIDVLHIAKSVWRRIWLVLLVAIIAGGFGFSVSAFLIKPTYSSTIMLYVNNSSFSLGNTSFSISSSEITAAQSLVKTYGEILDNRTTLERVIDKADVDYTAEKLSDRIKSGSSNNTEIMYVTVTTNDPYESANIANCIAEVLPVRIAEIVDGASMEVVDSAVPNLKKVAPSVTQYTAIGLALGALIAVVILVVAAMLDDRIHDEDYIIETYEYPILAKIPNLTNADTGKYKYNYYYQSGSHSKSDAKKETADKT